MTPSCDTHGIPLVVVTFCPACRGQKGGQRTSPRKRRAARLNARRPRPRKRTQTMESPPPEATRPNGNESSLDQLRPETGDTWACLPS